LRRTLQPLPLLRFRRARPRVLRPLSDFVPQCPRCGRRHPLAFFLELALAIERGGNPGLLFDYGAGFWGDHGILGTAPPGTTPTTVRLQMPRRPIRALRFDPATDDSPIDLTGLRLVTDRGELLLRLDPAPLRPWHQIAAIEPIPGGVRIRPTPKADDPMLHLYLEPSQQRMHAAMQRPIVGPGTVTALAVLLAALLATGTRLGAIAALTLAAALPYDGRNLLWGGQTQMYAVVLLTVCTLALASATPSRWNLSATDGPTVALVTLDRTQVRRLRANDVPHARELASA